MGRHSRDEEPASGPSSAAAPHGSDPAAGSDTRSDTRSDTEFDAAEAPTDQFAAARHRNHTAGLRVSRGPVLGVVALAAVVLLVFGWFQLRSTVDEEGVRAAATCVDGNQMITIAADPDVAPALTEIARRFDATDPVIRDHCIDVQVRPVPSAAALSGLTTSWDEATLGPRPAGWVAADSSWTDQLAAAAPARLDGDPTAVAMSPLVLAVARDGGPALTRATLSWAGLPGLQALPDGWARYGKPGWGSLKVALPTGIGGDTMAPDAAQAVATGLNGGTVPSGAALDAPGVRRGLVAFGQGPDPQPATTEAALDQLATATTVAGLAFQAVPATEQEVFATARAHPGAASAAMLDGAVPVADYPFALLGGAGVDDTGSRATAAFEEYVMAPDAQQVLADDGFRTGSATLPDGGANVPFGPMPPTLARADVPVADAITAAVRSTQP